MRTPTARADKRLTYDDFVLFPDDGKRHEIIDGEHCVTPSPNRRHQRLVGRLHLEIAQVLKADPASERSSSRPSTSCCRSTMSSGPTCCSLLPTRPRS